MMSIDMTLMAQWVVLRRWQALQTLPQLPLPMQSWRMQFSIFLIIQKQNHADLIEFDISKWWAYKIVKFDMATWYGKTSNKQLDTLIERKCKFRELFMSAEFMNELKAYNTKLLDYFSSNPSLFDEVIQFLTQPPAPNDPDQRKFKYPLMAVEMVQTQTTCILNTLFKEINPTSKATYLEALFAVLDTGEILPLLAGYFFRVNLCLMNNRQKQTIQLLYCVPHLIFKLVEHAGHMSIANTIQLYLNLDINKHQSVENEARAKVKVDMVHRILQKIDQQSRNKSERSYIVVENLCVILCETIEKYYLIVDGKQMMEVITSEKTVGLLMGLLRSQQTQFSFPAFNFFISLINYYSFSSFNVDDTTTENGKKNLERLENQPMILQLSAFFPIALEKVMRSPTMNLYLYRLLEILCHCISISSIKIFESIKKTSFFGCLISLMFKHQKNNILHMLIEKSFLHVFISDRKIYLEYKKHLFCQLDIIEITAGVFQKLLGTENMFQQGRKKPYFGHFMRILKIYSQIQTVEPSIVGVIKTKSELWNKIVKHLINPYQAINQKKLGSYENVPQPEYQHFHVEGAVKGSTKLLRQSTIEQIKKEESVPMPRTPSLESSLPSSKITSELNNLDKAEETADNKAFEETKNTEEESLTYRPKPNHQMSQSSVIDNRTQQTEKQLRKSQSFKDFMTKKRVEVGNDLKTQRSVSQEKRLSGQKMRISNPSPNKKNSWKESKPEQQERKESEDRNSTPSKQAPRIPPSRRPLAQSSVIERKNKTPDDESEGGRSNRSMVNMSELKKIKVYQIQKPAEKKYRKVEDKDKLLLDFLGLAV